MLGSRLKLLRGFVLGASIYAAFVSQAEGVVGLPFFDVLDVPLSQTTATTEAAEKYLQANKFIFTDRYFRNVYEAYLKSDLPVFITTDAVLNAFHVLVRHSFTQLAENNALRLKQILDSIWGKIRPEAQPRAAGGLQALPRKTIASKSGDASQTQFDHWRVPMNAKHRAQYVIAVALALLGDRDDALADPLKTAVAAEANRIIRADVERPQTTTGPASALFFIHDYARFRPKGLYVQSENLKRYYRAVTWLQSVSFSPTEDTELLAILILGQVISDPYAEDQIQRWRTENFLKCYREYQGQAAPLDLLSAAHIVRDRPADLAVVRRFLAGHHKDALKTKRSKNAPAKISGMSNRGAFYILAPQDDAAEALFSKVTEPEFKNRQWPSGLDLTAVLGSQTARLRLASPGPGSNTAALMQVIDSFKPRFDGDGVDQGHYGCLKALLDDPEPDAPFFMQSTVWRLKTVNTALASWVQFRYNLLSSTSQLGAESEGTVSHPYAGFVEPDPDFFSRLGNLADRCRDLLNRCNAYHPARYQIASDLRWLGGQIESKRFPSEPNRPIDVSPAENIKIERTLKILAAIGNLRLVGDSYVQRRRAVVDRITLLADQIEAGFFEQDPTYQALLLEMMGDFDRLWEEFRHICRRLEVIAHKQLRQVELNPSETQFILTFGQTLASIVQPSEDREQVVIDEGPMVIDFFYNPNRKSGMYAAVGRWREIIVMYPVNGQDVRSRGAVLPYYEFIPSKSADYDEWIGRVDSNQPPAGPPWLVPVLAPQLLLTGQRDAH